MVPVITYHLLTTTADRHISYNYDFSLRIYHTKASLMMSWLRFWIWVTSSMTFRVSVMSSKIDLYSSLVFIVTYAISCYIQQLIWDLKVQGWQIERNFWLVAYIWSGTFQCFQILTTASTMFIQCTHEWRKMLSYIMKDFDVCKFSSCCTTIWKITIVYFCLRMLHICISVHS